MTSVHWRLVEVLARLLKPGERETVLGDLLENCDGGWRGLLDVLGLVIRHQLSHWKNWQPWLAVFGLALPGSLVLMGTSSVSVSSMSKRLIDHRILLGFPHAIHEGFLQLLCRGLLLIACSWACGFVTGSISPGTLWAGIASSCFACWFCFARFREPSLSRFCLFLFLLPAIWGVREALRSIRINFVLAVFLVIAVTALMILLSNSRGLWTLNWSLVWPACYIVANGAKNWQTKLDRVEWQMNEESTA
jgi:hypothetical protein